jgi:hypothetical protein
MKTARQFASMIKENPGIKIMFVDQKTWNKLVKEMSYGSQGILQINLRGVPVFPYGLWKDLLDGYQRRRA